MKQLATCCEHGDDAFSYKTCIRTKDEEGNWILNVTQYSVTTSRHQADAFNGRKEGKKREFYLKGTRLDSIPYGATADDLRKAAKAQV